MKTNLFKRWIKIPVILFIFLCLFIKNTNVNAQDSLVTKEQKVLITSEKTLDIQKSKLEIFTDFIEKNPIIALVLTFFGLMMGVLKFYDLMKKLFPKWFSKKLKPFKSKDLKNFKILIVPSRNYSESDELLELLAIRFMRKHKDENLNVLVKRSNNKKVDSSHTANILGEQYNADMVIWVDYFNDNKEAHIAYLLLPGKRKRISFIEKKGEVRGIETFANIKEGKLLGDIDNVMLTVLGITTLLFSEDLKRVVSMQKNTIKKLLVLTLHYNQIPEMNIFLSKLKQPISISR